MRVEDAFMCVHIYPLALATNKKSMFVDCKRV